MKITTVLKERVLENVGMDRFAYSRLTDVGSSVCVHTACNPGSQILAAGEGGRS